MYLIVTRSFPPELGGMQNLMWGLSRELSKNFMIKVFADHIEGHKNFDEQASFSIERVGGIKLLRKYRKAQLINEYIKENHKNPYRIMTISTCAVHFSVAWICIAIH